MDKKVVDLESRKFWAFISYSGNDQELANRFHHQLETYSVPSKLVGDDSVLGPIPERLNPVCVDRGNFPASSDIHRTIEAALNNSKSLIVLVSPDSVQSDWVNREIRHFQEQGLGDRIYCVLTGPSTEGKLEFPPSLTSGPSVREPLAADLRTRGARKQAVLKTIAGVLGIDFDDLKERDAERKIRRLTITISVLSIVLSFMVALIVYAEVKRREALLSANEARLQKREATISYEDADAARSNA
ncbi:MAG: toll/interleukin-1 receptor domain-containing protein, partial [Verrucomicrobiota bacterium]